MADLLRVILADDEPLALDRLQFAFRDIPDTVVLGTATNGPQAARLIAELRPDVAILDIEMPGRTGLGVAADLPERDRPDIIFLTAFDQHAVDAFAVQAADYILKPLRLDRLRLAIERVRRRRLATTNRVEEAGESPPTGDGDPGCFWVSGPAGLIRVDHSAIDWIEAAKDYVLLHTAERSHILRGTMSSIVRAAASAQFVRVHRSAIVRRTAVASLHFTPSGAAIISLRDGLAIPVGPSYLPEVRQQFGNPGE